MAMPCHRLFLVSLVVSLPHMRGLTHRVAGTVMSKTIPPWNHLVINWISENEKPVHHIAVAIIQSRGVFTVVSFVAKGRPA